MHMRKNNIGAFLYSDRNQELAATLKTFCNNYNVCLFYITDLKEFFIKAEGFENAVLFIDNYTIKVSADLLTYITVKQKETLYSIIYLCDGKIDDENIVDNEKIFKVNVEKNFYSQMVEIIGKMRQTRQTFKVKNLTKEWATLAYDYLVNLNLSPKHAGFSYLKDTIIYCLSEDGKVGNLNKGIYNYLSAKYNTTVFNIERNIRLAIESAWKNNNFHILNFKNRPSNKEFIAVVVNKIYNGIG